MFATNPKRNCRRQDKPAFRDSYGYPVCWGLAWGLLLVALVFGGWRLSQGHYFDVQQISVRGNFTMVNHIRLRQLLQREVHGNVFRVSIKRLSLQLQQWPWIKNVTIRRLWPNQIDVLLQQKTAVARFNDKALMDASGQLFVPAVMPKQHYLRLWGANDDAADLWRYSRIFQTMLAPVHLQIASLRLSERGSWSMVFENGAVMMLGQTFLLKRLQSFVHAFSKIESKPKQPLRIDLRYSNGFAIQWEGKKSSISA